MTRAWDKEKVRVTDRNRPHDLPNTEGALYPVYCHQQRYQSSVSNNVDSSAIEEATGCVGEAQEESLKYKEEDAFS